MWSLEVLAFFLGGGEPAGLGPILPRDLVFGDTLWSILGLIAFRAVRVLQVIRRSVRWRGSVAVSGASGFFLVRENTRALAPYYHVI